MKCIKCSILSLMILLLVNCGENQPVLNKETLKWMEETSGIQIPKTSKFINSFPYNEFGEILKFKLDSQEVNSFITRYALYKVQSMNDIYMVQMVDIEDNWKGGYFEDIGNQNYYYFSDKNDKKLRWNVLLNKDTKELWFEILYDDD